MPLVSAGKRIGLIAAMGALAILTLAPTVAARDAWTTKSLTVWDETAGCPGTLTVGVQWDKKGGPISTVDFHLFAWDAVNTQWQLVSDVLGLVPDSKQAASYSFTGLSWGSFAFTAEVRNAKLLALGLYNGMTDGPTITC
jgi:hypothetical protein